MEAVLEKPTIKPEKIHLNLPPTQKTQNLKTSQTTLKNAPHGKPVTVSKVGGTDPAFRRRIMEMGIVEGTPITVVKTAPLGDPIQIKVRGYVLAIRKKDASCIVINN
jgi:Fe2+ transport system protein FeoA